MKENVMVRSANINWKDENLLRPGCLVFIKTSPQHMSQPSYMVHIAPLPSVSDTFHFRHFRNVLLDDYLQYISTAVTNSKTVDTRI